MPLSSWLTSAANLAYHFPGPVSVCWSQPAPESLSGNPSHSSQMLIQRRRSFVPQPCTFFLFFKRAFHFNDDTSQRWGSCYHTEGIWAEVVGAVNSSSRGIPSFLHKFPMQELCVISHSRRERQCLAPVGRADSPHFSSSREESGSIDTEFIVVKILVFSWCI